MPRVIWRNRTKKERGSAEIPNITEIRRTTGLSQEELARMIGFSSRSVSGWERGITIPSFLAIEKILKIEEEFKAKDGKNGEGEK